MIFFPFFVYLCPRKDKGVPGKGLRPSNLMQFVLP